jgi:hypothetical protein
LVPVRKGTDDVLPFVGQTDTFQEASRLYHSQIPGRPEEGRAFSLMGEHGHLNILENGKPGENVYDLKRPADSSPASFIGGKFTDVFLLEDHPSSVSRELAGYEIK